MLWCAQSNRGTLHLSHHYPSHFVICVSSGCHPHGTQHTPASRTGLQLHKNETSQRSTHTHRLMYTAPAQPAHNLLQARGSVHTCAAGRSAHQPAEQQARGQASRSAVVHHKPTPAQVQAPFHASNTTVHSAPRVLPAHRPPLLSVKHTTCPAEGFGDQRTTPRLIPKAHRDHQQPSAGRGRLASINGSCHPSTRGFRQQQQRQYPSPAYLHKSTHSCGLKYNPARATVALA